MTLNAFKQFYFQQFPNIKEMAKNQETKRVNNKCFLAHMLGDNSCFLNTFSDTNISLMMTGKWKAQITTELFSTYISGIENIITQDMSPKISEYREISSEAFRIINSSASVEPIHQLLLNTFRSPNDPDSVVKGLKWWFIYLVMQDDISKLYRDYEKELTKIEHTPSSLTEMSTIEIIEDFLIQKGIRISENSGRKCAEISYKYLHDLRRLLIDNAKGKIYISGETLGNAFSATEKNNAPIIKNLLYAVQGQRLTEINVFVMDPCVFGTQQLNEPIDTLGTSIMALIDQLKLSLHHNHCKLNIHFVPFLDIDHAIITDEFLLLRTTKLWTNEKDLKGSVMLYYKYDTNSKDNVIKVAKEYYDSGEYNAHKKFLDTISENCVLIDTTKEYEIRGTLSRDLHIHYDIRNSVYNQKKHGNYSIELYKIYSSQLNQLAVSSFSIDKSRFIFSYNQEIQCKEDLFNPNNLLNDNTQKTLLPYIKTTESLLKAVVKKYDKRKESGAIIIPSLDLGYPNNITRLAGGFATGMLIDWECGTPIIPIDSTVNVCSSSVFKISDLGVLKDFENNIKNIFIRAVFDCGYSFSFDSGNHFLMIATDEYDEYYLVLHSSVKEMKETYLGLYPKEDNWYSSNIKVYKEQNRYLRYIKDDDAKHFIKTAHNLEKYNEEIHKWLAKSINNNIEPSESNIKHHYYMPTESSIAIGTFAELPGETVALFSDLRKPVYLFEIGRDNWTYNLGGRKGSICIVPHGWGQQIESIREIICKENNISFIRHDNSVIDYDLISTTRINERIDDNMENAYKKRIREFENGQDFLNIGNRYIHGSIKKVLKPKYLYCKRFVGKLEE